MFIQKIIGALFIFLGSYLTIALSEGAVGLITIPIGLYLMITKWNWITIEYGDPRKEERK